VHDDDDDDVSVSTTSRVVVFGLVVVMDPFFVEMLTGSFIHHHTMTTNVFLEAMNDGG